MHYRTRVSGKPAGSSRIIGAGVANEAAISVARGAMDAMAMVGSPDRRPAPVWIRTAGIADIDCLSDHFGAQMKNLACKAGFAFSRSSDWCAVRFDKTLVGPIVPLPGSGPHGGSEPDTGSCDQLAVTL